MENLGKYLTKPNVIAALEQVIKERPKLLKATKFALVYKGERFPPKEIARIAAVIGGIPKQELTEYTLSGGDSINQHFEKLGFEIINFKAMSKSPEVTKGAHGLEKRLARLCWNDKGWVRPSGHEGKSEDKGSHEARFGYGHEEWLFDTSKLIDGYCHGFLEPIRKRINAYKDKSYDVTFFTIDGRTKARYWVGRIKELEVIGPEKAEEIRQEYLGRGWLLAMENQVKHYQAMKPGLEPLGWSNYQGLDFFNVRFRPEALTVENMYARLSPDNPVVYLNRYSFNSLKDEYAAGSSDDTSSFSFKGTGKPLDPDDDGELLTRTYMREPVAVEITFLHKKISNGLVRKLRSIYGGGNVDPNCDAGFMGREVDIIADQEGEIVFYEIKTYNSLMQSIRVAIGQIMEYALWSRHVRAAKWVIVTQPHVDIESTKAYFDHLRTRYNLPLFFCMYDWKTDVLTELV